MMKKPLEICEDCGKAFRAGPREFVCPDCRRKRMIAGHKKHRHKCESGMDEVKSDAEE